MSATKSLDPPLCACFGSCCQCFLCRSEEDEERWVIAGTAGPHRAPDANYGASGAAGPLSAGLRRTDTASSETGLCAESPRAVRVQKIADASGASAIPAAGD